MSPPTMPSENTGSESLSSEAEPGKPVRDARSRAKRIGSFFLSNLKSFLSSLKSFFFSRQRLPLVVFVVLLVLLFLVMHASVASVVSSIVAHPPGPAPKNTSWIDLIIRTPVVTTMLRLLLIFGGLFVVTSLVVALIEGRMFDKFPGGLELGKITRQRDVAFEGALKLQDKVVQLEEELRRARALAQKREDELQGQTNTDSPHDLTDDQLPR